MATQYHVRSTVPDKTESEARVVCSFSTVRHRTGHSSEQRNAIATSRTVRDESGTGSFACISGVLGARHLALSDAIRIQHAASGTPLRHEPQ